MRLTILALLLCLTVVLAQEAMPRLRYRAVFQEQGKKGKKPYPVKGGKEKLEKQIDDIQRKVAAANESVVPFKGGSLKGLTGLLKVNLAVTNLGKTIDTTTAVADATNVLSAADSTQVGIKFLGLQPDINSLLTNLKSKRREFDKAGFKILDVRSLIRDSVTIQQGKADDLGRSFTKTLDAQFQPIAKQVSAQIQGNFSDVIEAYKGRGGKIKIPPKLVPKLSQILAKLAKALGLGKMDKGMMVDKNMMVLVGLVAPETDAATPEPDSAAAAEAAAMTELLNAEAASAEIAAADTAEANAAAQEALLATPDAELMSLGENENDLRGISPVVLDVLRSFEII
ncbi:uncharacterized protein LY79DRAFT_671414 [Colletotrichum navitas]|uniref:Antigenic cell wall n=1 Tax=Colletotrichum navitas TaxID=681940 RepID=A0AAD8PVI6_9PEZI|nr:uncharacterized protein LY79DRAFT_671414 [Colletotrichum navitas]KAK1584983.1 hypothetical protein LY79DRAFT_671414 [Colletotrichum navitas]